jgi:hypothetical protein
VDRWPWLTGLQCAIDRLLADNKLRGVKIGRRHMAVASRKVPAERGAEKITDPIGAR